MPNGNIQALNRNALGPQVTPVMDSPQIDALTYEYYPKTNQLARIRDAVSHPLQGKGAGKFGDLITQPEGNYTYDALGRLVADKGENYRIVYDAYDKVAEVRTLDPGKPIVRFVYDDGGHRVQKLAYTEAGAIEAVTYYFRDAQGNALGVYTQTGTTGPLTLKEHTVYSSGRLGLYYRQENRYSYELKDHLGNVRAVVNRRVVDETNPPTDAQPILAYLADYYPFGWLMPDRKVLEYRYGYNDQETDPETGWQAYTFREYDARVARFFRVDPLTQEYPFWTPYQFAGNTPVGSRELEGLEEWQSTDGEIIFGPFSQDYIANENLKPVYEGTSSYSVDITDTKFPDGSFRDFHSSYGFLFSNFIESHRAWSTFPDYHEGESHFARSSRLRNAWSMEARREWASGAYDMYGGWGSATSGTKLPTSAFRMYRSALQSYRGGLTNAGRALQKHPELVNLTPQTFRTVYKTNIEINAKAAEMLKEFMRNGTPGLEKAVTLSGGTRIAFRLQNGNGASFHAETGMFVGFLNR